MFIPLYNIICIICLIYFGVEPLEGSHPVHSAVEAKYILCQYKIHKLIYNII